MEQRRIIEDVMVEIMKYFDLNTLLKWAFTSKKNMNYIEDEYADKSIRRLMNNEQKNERRIEYNNEYSEQDNYEVTKELGDIIILNCGTEIGRLILEDVLGWSLIGFLTRELNASEEILYIIINSNLIDIYWKHFSEDMDEEKEYPIRKGIRNFLEILLDSAVRNSRKKEKVPNRFYKSYDPTWRSEGKDEYGIEALSCDEADIGVYLSWLKHIIRQDKRFFKHHFKDSLSDRLKSIKDSVFEKVND